MATFDARPSGFTQLTTMADWENFLSTVGVADGIDGANSFVPSFDVPGRNIVIGAGQATVRGQLWRCDANVPTAIPAASAQNRIDRLVLRLNRGATSGPTVVQPVVITGTPSGSPVEPPYTRTLAGLWDLPVCSWLSTSAGALSTLTDERQYAGLNIANNGTPWTVSPHTQDPTYLKIQQGNSAPVFVNQNGFLVPAMPGSSPPVPETWHQFTLINGWAATSANVYHYRKNIENWLEIIAYLNYGASVTNANIASIPSGWRPPVQHVITCAGTAGVPAGATPICAVTSGGTLFSAGGLTITTAGSLNCVGKIPLFSVP